MTSQTIISKWIMISISGCSKTINITNPPSTNNNLSSLTVSNGSLNFNKNNKIFWTKGVKISSLNFIYNIKESEL